MRWTRALALAFAWIVFVAALLELAGFVAFAVVGLEPFASYGYPTGLIVDDARLGWRYQPGYRGHFKGNLAYLDVPIRINDAGFRDVEFAAKTAGQPRLVVVGDSVVFGPGVAAEVRFTEQLAERAAAIGWPLEVRNLGVNGYTFSHYVEFARLGFFGLQPDGVLFGFTLNDIEPGPFAGGRNAAPNGDPGPLRIAFGRVIDWCERSYASRFVDELTIRIKVAARSEEEGVAYHTRWMRSVVGFWQEEGARDRLASELDAMRSHLADTGTPFAVVIFPELNDLLEPQHFAFPRESILRMLAERQIPVCDPYPLFRAQADVRPLFLYGDSVHYTAAGNALLAEALLDCFRSGRMGPLGAALRAPAGTEAGATRASH